jgi:hypothetical protein
VNNHYLIEENRILHNQIDRRILLTNAERKGLAEKTIALGKLMANIYARPDICLCMGEQCGYGGKQYDYTPPPYEYEPPKKKK